MNWILMLLVFIYITSFSGAGSSVFDERIVLADEIASGKLTLNECAEKHLEIGDSMMEMSDKNWRKKENNYSGLASWEDMLFFAFNAKIHYERARLCMEIQSNE